MRSDNDQVKNAARATLNRDHAIRMQRAAIARIRAPLTAHLRIASRTMQALGMGAPPTCVSDRTVCDCGHTQRLPGRRVRGENDPDTGDAAVDKAFEYLGDTLDFYCQEYSRNSIDNHGMPLVACVHYDQNYDNAFWNGQQMVFGDGDQTVFQNFVLVDVVGHELTHGVTENEAGLVYLGQSGALNESISDVFGSLIKQYKNKQNAEDADWLIGEGIFAPGIQGVALRSMKAPGTAYDDPQLGKDPQPANISDYDRSPQDNFGVHINSGIPNHAFFLAATKIGGPAWEKAGQVWYDTLRSPFLRPHTRFRQFAQITLFTAGKRYGVNAAETAAIREAWAEVGITLPGFRSVFAMRPMRRALALM